MSDPSREEKRLRDALTGALGRASRAEDALAAALERIERLEEELAGWSPYGSALPEPCGCRTRCGDVAETNDGPRAVCKGLPQ